MLWSKLFRLPWLRNVPWVLKDYGCGCLRLYWKNSKEELFGETVLSCHLVICGMKYQLYRFMWPLFLGGYLLWTIWWAKHFHNLFCPQLKKMHYEIHWHHRREREREREIHTHTDTHFLRLWTKSCEKIVVQNLSICYRPVWLEFYLWFIQIRGRTITP